MKMLMMIEAFFLILAALQDHTAAAEGKIFPLDMALNSVDDQYKGCREKMLYQVKTTYFNKEIYASAQFKKAWQLGEKYAKMPTGQLTRTHLIAIYVYSDNDVYKLFNSDSRYSRKLYKQMTYKWFTLQFLLTEAIQILSKQKKECMVTFRGTSVEFDKNVLNKEVRFGSFASSSLDQKVAKGFGSKSCFEILTCEAGKVAPYSKFPYEKEVLIPPYEKFRVTNVWRKQYNKGLWCDTVYALKSSGTVSYLNCALMPQYGK